MTESISNPKYALGADATEQTRQRRRADMLGMEYLPSLQSGMAVLDVGCGVGATTQLVARQVHPGTVVGVDKESRLISQAKKDAQDLDLRNLEYHTGDASRLPLNSESFDLVYSRFLLAWVADPQQAVREQIRTTRSGGSISAVDVDFDAVIWHPPLPAFKKTRDAYIELLERQDADPFIGRKLYGLFIEAGLDEVVLEVHPILAYGPQNEVLKGMLAHETARLESTGAQMVAQSLVSQVDLDEAMSELNRAEDDPQTIWWGALFACEGRKP